MCQHVALTASCSAGKATCVSCGNQGLGAAFGRESSVEDDGGQLARKFSEKFHLPLRSEHIVNNFLKAADCYFEDIQNLIQSADKPL
jgi:hypothetical protein